MHSAADCLILAPMTGSELPENLREERALAC